MPASSEFLTFDELPVRTKALRNLILSACNGAEIATAAHALQSALIDTMLQGCDSYEQYMANVERLREALEMNGRQMFRRSN